MKGWGSKWSQRFERALWIIRISISSCGRESLRICGSTGHSDEQATSHRMRSGKNRLPADDLVLAGVRRILHDLMNNNGYFI